MTTDDGEERAAELFHRAYHAQMSGDLDGAVRLYQASIAAHPTAEAHTFLGWTYSFQGDLDGAIEECRKAIAVDPTFGNPYNDIGAYLLQQGRPQEAISWLEQATRAPRYEAPHFPWLNLGRACVTLEMYARALASFERALELSPGHEGAEQAIRTLKLKLN